MSDFFDDDADYYREAYGPSGKLALLRSKGRDQYEVTLELPGGWLPFYAAPTPGDKAVPVVEIRINESEQAATNAQIEAAINTATDFAFEKRVYKIEQEHTKRPVDDPRQWTIFGYYTKGVWPTP